MARAGVCAAATWLLVVQGASGIDALAQALPPPRDGDIRVLYWELQKETQVWLTLEPKSADGKTAPLLTLTLQFPGKQPKTQPQHVELRAYAGFLWAPKVELWFVLDEGPRIDLAPPGVVGLASGTVSDYLAIKISIVGLRQMAEAKRIRGNALGLDFELTESQVRAMRAFLDRVLSDNPAQLGK